jgi:hypothetical protein
MSKVSEVKVPTTGRYLGTFRVGRFNLFDDGELREYEALRTKGNDRASGVTIEHVQQFTRMVTETETAGDGEVTTRREDLYVLVQYWEKGPLGIGKEEALTKPEPPRDWYVEREAPKG